MTTKGLSWKQIIVSMGKNNINKFMALSSIHIANLNISLKNIKSDVIADYIQSELIDITNKVALSLNF